MELKIVLGSLIPIICFLMYFYFKRIADYIEETGEKTQTWHKKYASLNGVLLMRPKKGIYGWYHKQFGLTYKEKFLFSGTRLVFLTDRWHLYQFLMSNSLNLAITSQFTIIADSLHALWLFPIIFIISPIGFHLWSPKRKNF